MENPDNVLPIYVHVNRTIIAFKESKKPHWAESNSEKLAWRYAAAYNQNQRLLAHMEYSCKKAQEIPEKENLGAQ